MSMNFCMWLFLIFVLPVDDSVCVDNDTTTAIVLADPTPSWTSVTLNSTDGLNVTFVAGNNNITTIVYNTSTEPPTTSYDPCAVQPCVNGGTCQIWNGTYNCTCAVGYTGENCTACIPIFFKKTKDGTCKDVNECLNSNPCNLGSVFNCRNTVGSYQCSCPVNYANISGTCQIPDARLIVNLTFFNQTYSENLADQSSARFLALAANITTAINAHFEGNLSYSGCEVFDFSAGSVIATTALQFSSHPNVTAVDQELKLFMSNCNPNCAGLGAMQAASVSNVTSGCQYNTFCPSDTVCAELNGVQLKFLCKCRDGYNSTGQMTDMAGGRIESCVARRYCAELPEICGNDGTCNDVVGNYTCLCSTSSVFDGVTCIKSDVCNGNPCNNGATCTAIRDSYQCSCHWFYMGLTCEDSLPFILFVISLVLAGLLAIVVASFYCYFRSKQNHPGKRDQVSLSWVLDDAQRLNQRWNAEENIYDNRISIISHNTADESIDSIQRDVIRDPIRSSFLSFQPQHTDYRSLILDTEQQPVGTHL